MKKQDLYFAAGCALALLPFFVSPQVYEFYKTFNAQHAYIASAVKFAALSTAGECIGLRILKGVYNQRGFGILPRALVWAFLGVCIKAAMVIFSAGVPAALVSAGLKNAAAVMAGPLSLGKVFAAFCISVGMNGIFAPVFMTFHKITDAHILQTGGTLRGLFKPLDMGAIMASLDWRRQWDFVFKKTIPLFWFPAHTITFLLPGDWQVLFAALLGVALGILLALVNKK
ncbi:MAG: hypothetical protein LBR90_04250 [Elusimicrobiota bacterium]|jgi:hypothetical protein|nr:hypothetical protein [Elusimicrobiota bacterium]